MAVDIVVETAADAASDSATCVVAVPNATITAFSRSSAWAYCFGDTIKIMASMKPITPDLNNSLLISPLQIKKYLLGIL